MSISSVLEEFVEDRNGLSSSHSKKSALLKNPFTSTMEEGKESWALRPDLFTSTHLQGRLLSQ